MQGIGTDTALQHYDTGFSANYGEASDYGRGLTRGVTQLVDGGREGGPEQGGGYKG